MDSIKKLIIRTRYMLPIYKTLRPFVARVWIGWSFLVLFRKLESCFWNVVFKRSFSCKCVLIFRSFWNDKGIWSKSPDYSRVFRKQSNRSGELNIGLVQSGALATGPPPQQPFVQLLSEENLWDDAGWPQETFTGWQDLPVSRDQSQYLQHTPPAGLRILLCPRHGIIKMEILGIMDAVRLPLSPSLLSPGLSCISIVNLTLMFITQLWPKGRICSHSDKV